MARHALALVVFCLALAACGGGHKAKPPPGAESFRAEANRVCAGAKTHAARLAGLRRLRAPAGAEELYSRWLKAERDAVEAAKPEEGTSGEPPFDLRTPLTVAEGKIAGYARRLGVTGCK